MQCSYSIDDLLDMALQRQVVTQYPFVYEYPASTALNQLTYYAHDHLGNLRVAFTPVVDCNSPTGTEPDPLLNHPNSSFTLEQVVDYYPYGKILRQYINANGPERYMTTQHERDQETELDYRGARYYDSDVARFLSTDPLAAKFPGWSPYNFVMGNPIRYIDPDGRAPDDIHLDDQGKVKEVVQNDQPNRFFDDGGTEITPHDKGGADSQLLTRKFEVGDQVLFNVPKETYATGLLRAGIDPLVSKLVHSPMTAAALTAWGSYSKADFGVGFLASNFSTQGSSGSSGVIRGGYPEEAGYFRFEGTNEMYNLYDAGNHMWGSWMNLNGYSQKGSLNAADWNSLLSGQGHDTPADQRAITNGFNYSLR